MNLDTKKVLSKLDLSLLAIEAAEELERFRKGMTTDFSSVNELSSVLQGSITRISSSEYQARLDSVAVFSSAIKNSYGFKENKQKTISEISKEAIAIASKLTPEQAKSADTDLEALIVFCVALSDSALLYNEEVEESKKYFA